MVPKLHAKGSSFKGAAAYLLHDKDRATTDERVAWTETRNLATDNPNVAWKVMAATAMDQARLKEQAGIKKTGRKSLDSVLHFTLSWHPDEHGKIDREEMRRAIKGALKALQAEDRQAMIVSHSDEKHPHVHILVNRVSPQDGKMLSSSKEKLALSSWAETYEKERGKIYCEERVLNNEARKRGQFRRGDKDRARHIFETETANDNVVRKEQIRKQQRVKDAEVAKSAREAKERNQRRWSELRAGFRKRNEEIKNRRRMEAVKEKDAVRGDFRPQYEELFHEQQAEKAQFVKNEKSLLGRVYNGLKSIDFKTLVARRAENGSERKQILGGLFDALSSAGARLEALKARHARQKSQMERSEKRSEKLAARPVDERAKAALQKNRDDLQLARADLIRTQRLEGAKCRADWKTRNEQRLEAWRPVHHKPAEDGHKPKDEAQLARARQLAESFRKRQSGRTNDNDRDRERGD